MTGPFEKLVESANIAEPLEAKYGIEMYATVGKHQVSLMQIRISQEQQGKGLGGKALEDLKTLAKKLDLPIFLIPEHEPRKKAALLRFYKKHGFVVNKGRHKDYSLGSAFAAGMYWRPTWD